MYVACTVNLTHLGTVVSRWSDARGSWAPLPGFKPTLGEDYAVIWAPSDEEPNGVTHVRYKFRGGAEVTQERLHSLLDEARALGNSKIAI